MPPELDPGSSEMEDTLAVPARIGADAALEPSAGVRVGPHRVWSSAEEAVSLIKSWAA